MSYSEVKPADIIKRLALHPEVQERRKHLSKVNFFEQKTAEPFWRVFLFRAFGVRLPKKRLPLVSFSTEEERIRYLQETAM